MLLIQIHCSGFLALPEARLRGQRLLVTDLSCDTGWPQLDADNPEMVGLVCRSWSVPSRVRPGHKISLFTKVYLRI